LRSLDLRACCKVWAVEVKAARGVGGTLAYTLSIISVTAARALRYPLRIHIRLYSTTQVSRKIATETGGFRRRFKPPFSQDSKPSHPARHGPWQA
jgi:hypothetical protein